MSAWSRRSFLKTTAAAGLAVLPPAGGLAARGPAEPGPVEPGPTEPGPTEPGPSPRLAGGLDDPLGIRAQFPVTEELAYLNTASMGPLSTAVRDALAAYADEKMLVRNPGSRRAAKAGAREKFARLFGADEEELAFLYSTSDGENIVASAIDWRRGDNVVLDELHFTTSFVLYRELERRAGVELRIVPSSDGRALAEDFEARTDARTRLLSVAWVSNRNGFRHDLTTLAEIAHAEGAYLYADGIQAFGAFPADLHAYGVDFACGNGYKWLFADFGCAVLYVRREHLEWMTPDRFGHGQVAQSLPDHRYRLKTSAEKFEHANPAYGPITAMDAALGFLEEVGLDRIAEHTVSLAGELRDGVAELGLDLFTPPNNPSSIVSFYHGLDAQELSDALRAEGVPISFQEEGRLLRAAVSMFNNKSDTDRLLAVLARLV